MGGGFVFHSCCLDFSCFGGFAAASVVVLSLFMLFVFFLSVCSTEYEEVRDLYLRAVQSATPQDEVDADVQVGHLWPCQHQLDSKSSATVYSPHNH